MRRRTIGLVAVLWAAIVPASSHAAPPDLDVRRDASPTYAGFNDRLLTGPSSATPEAIAFEYAREHLGIAAGDLATLELVARAVSPDGVTHLRYNQVLDGIESYDSGLQAHVAADGRLVSLSANPVPDARLPGTDPGVSALAGLGAARRSARGLALPPKVTEHGRTTTFATGEVAKLRWIATDGGPRLAWNVVADGEEGAAYSVVVDATSGDPLVRDGLTDHLGEAFYFPKDPDTSPVTQITMPPAWYDNSNGGTRLWGQYARTYLDPNNENPAPGQEQGGTRVQIQASGGAPSEPDWIFARSREFPGASPCPPGGCAWNSAIPSTQSVNQFEAATSAHVLVGSYLEYLAQPPIGFDAASGNFRGNDYVRAEINDGSDRNNADFATLPDGTPPRMQMFLWDVRDANGADDAGIVYHELGHGLSNRLIVNASGVGQLGSELQSSMMGEGWSDFYALDLLQHQDYIADTAAPGEVRLGTHVYGPNGIRSKPIDCPVDPASATTACNRNGTATRVTGGYTYADLAVTTNSSPHNGGELWSETLWDLRARVGREAALALITGGMRLSPQRPSMLDMRDAILRQALALRSAPGAADDRYDDAWSVFAARGLGYGATSAGPKDTQPVESYALPPQRLSVRRPTLRDPYPGGDDDGRIEAGERFEVSAPASSLGLGDLSGATGRLTSSPGLELVVPTAPYPLLGNGRVAANATPLVARMPAGCAGSQALTITVSAPGATTGSTTLHLDPRPASIANVPLADRVGDRLGVTEATLELPPSGTITDVDARIDDLEHSFLGDLQIDLIHAGVTVRLLEGPDDWEGQDIVAAVFDSDAATAVTNTGDGPLTGTMRPQDASGLDRFDGKPAGGLWTLRITDIGPSDTGVLRQWGVHGPLSEFPCPRLEIPDAVTEAATGVGLEGATVAGSVDPNTRATGLRFAYGKSTAYGATTVTEAIGAGDDPVARTAALTGLEPGTTYHYRVEAIREGGQLAVTGADRTFTTAGAPAATTTATGAPEATASPDATASPQPGVSAEPTAAPQPPPAPDRTAPAFSGKPKVKLAKAGKRNRRATFSFALSEPASVSAVVTVAAPGIRRGAKCVTAPKREPKGAKRCTRQVPAARGAAGPGARTLALPAKGLGKGRYAATVTAVDASGNRSTATVTFTIR